ncbi:heme/hemin ABC transporter substrate-binding protein [Vagococcus sp. WN89Y]|uniref:heme/hemin ABC transporter substrate-binding protein n=1 Tax=Vagococcus sp. WN89Y TaxID=3457258 RepID=UPI003FCDC074
MKKALTLLAFLLPFCSAASERIVSLGGDVTEILYGLGAWQSLVARDSTSNWPASAQKLPDVGYVRQLNPEGILSLRPTLVLASAQARPSMALQTVEKNHVTVVPVPGGYTLAGIDKKVALIARATGKTAQAAVLRKKLDVEIAALPRQPLHKRVLFILSHGGMDSLVAGQETAADGAIREAGLENAMQGFSHYRAMSQEGVIASQPDLVVISEDGVKSIGGEENLWKLPGLSQTPAGRHKQVFIVDDVALLAFGLRTPRAVLALRQRAEQLP